MSATPKTCLYSEIVRVLAEEPRLEAVALRGNRKEISIATLGSEDSARLRRRVEDIVASHPPPACPLTVNGSCAGCGANPLDAAPPGARIVIKRIFNDVLIEKATCTTAVSFWHWVSLRWPKYVPREHGITDVDENEWKPMALQAAGCLVFGLAGWAAEAFHLHPALAIVLYVISYVFGAWDAAIEAWEKIRSAKLDIHFLMLAVACGAAVVGAWREGALLLFLFSASGAMEHYAMGRTRREIRSLLDGSPKTARVVGENDWERTVPVEQLTPGMRVRVLSGELIPVDMKVVKGESACDESNLTGESRPVSKQRGDTALAGTVNLWGVLEGVVLRPASESALQKIIGLIQRAQELKAPSQRFTDKFGTGYTWAILMTCTVMFFVWWLGFGLPAFSMEGETPSALYRAMTLLVVASPCALVLSVPSSILSAIASGARRGVLFRGGSAIENLASIDVVAMDKTGTLTSGELSLSQIRVLQGTEEELRRVAFSLARLSHHPLSRAILKSGETWNIEPAEVTQMESLSGKGLQGRIDGKLYRLGSSRWIFSEIPQPPVEAIGDSQSKPNLFTSEVWVSGEGLLGCFEFVDQLRPEAKPLLAELHRRGIHTAILTGDKSAIARAVAEELGVEEVYADLLPEQKVEAVEKLKRGGQRHVAMVGDGVNDAPCIAAADVGIAMGARGSDAALEQADVVLMHDRLENVLLARKLSEQSRRIIRQNIAVALGTVAIMVIATFLYPVPLALGVFAHEGSTVLVVLNSLRLLAVKLK